MANDYSAVLQTILSRASLKLRQSALMPQMVNRSIGEEFKKQGQSIDIDMPGTGTLVDVVPSATPRAAPDYTAVPKTLTLSWWKESPFKLDDQDRQFLQKGEDGKPLALPQRIEDAVDAVADGVNDLILESYKDVYNTVGSVGTIPFASTTAIAGEAKAIISSAGSMNLNNLMMVLEPFAYNNAAQIVKFADASASTDPNVIIEGRVGRKLGFNWVELNKMPYHTAGTGGTITSNGAHATTGVTTISIANSAAGTLLEGDIITIAGDTQNYVVGADVTWSGAGNQNVTISPGLKIALAGSDAITRLGSHTVNLAFHPDAIAFASRQMDDPDRDEKLIQFLTDPVSGLALRVEKERQHKQTVWSIDCLAGVVTLLPSRIVRVIG